MSFLQVAPNVLHLLAGGVSTTQNHECTCCKDCKSDKCKELCTKFDKMSSEEKKSKEGITVKEECAKLCSTEKCCSSSSSCDKKAKKGCCSKK